MTDYAKVTLLQEIADNLGAEVLVGTDYPVIRILRAIELATQA